MLFSVIIPNYNSKDWIKKGLQSIKEQTFTDYELIIVDDMSTDDSVQIIKDFNIDKKLIELKEKRWNGGSRNVGVENARGEYILFLDCDDWFDDRYCFEEIARVIQENDHPDCVRLPYRFIKGTYSQGIMLSEDRPSELVASIFVAPWTKCIKRELFAKFPENTMLEDVVQHIAQVDKIENVTVCEKPIVVWNRNNADAVSLPRKRSKIIQKENIKYIQECSRFNGFRVQTRLL